MRLSRAELIKRVFDLDRKHCPNCGGYLENIAAILEQPVIEETLTHLRLQAKASPRSAAQGRALQTAWRFRSEPWASSPAGQYAQGEHVTLADLALVSLVVGARWFQVDISAAPRLLALADL